MKIGLIGSLLVLCIPEEASARTPGISQLSTMLERPSIVLKTNAGGAVYEPDELAALRELGFSVDELAPRIESGCYSDIACEVRYRFSRLGEAERSELRANASAVIHDCKYIVFGGAHRFGRRSVHLSRLADARRRYSALVGMDSLSAKIIGTVCVAQADVVAAEILSNLSDQKIKMVIESDDDEQIHVLHLVAQHADRKPGFQARMVKLFGGLSCALYSESVQQKCAYLVDRVLINFGRNQTYGTQYDCNLLNRPDYPEIERRRKAIGLESLNAYQQCPR